MDPASFSELRAWLTKASLAGKSEIVLLDGLCRRALDAGLPIAHATIIIDTLHPVPRAEVAPRRFYGGS
jgi:adenylate cyclase